MASTSQTRPPLASAIPEAVCASVTCNLGGRRGRNGDKVEGKEVVGFGRWVGSGDP